MLFKDLDSDTHTQAGLKEESPPVHLAAAAWTEVWPLELAFPHSKHVM